MDMGHHANLSSSYPSGQVNGDGVVSAEHKLCTPQPFEIYGKGNLPAVPGKDWLWYI